MANRLVRSLAMGVVTVPTTPVGCYVYCPEVKKWVIHAESLQAGGQGEVEPCLSPGEDGTRSDL